MPTPDEPPFDALLGVVCFVVCILSIIGAVALLR